MQHFGYGNKIITRFPVTAEFARGESSMQFEKIKVDDGIEIDHANAPSNLDKSHLLLKGSLSSGEQYVRIKKNSETLVHIDHNGKIHALSGISAPELTAMESDINEIAQGITELDNDVTTIAQDVNTNEADIEHLQSRILDAEVATSDAVDNSLVRRDNIDGTVFTRIDASILDIQEEVGLYKDAKLNFIPYHTVNGEQVPFDGYQYRFGRAEEIGGDNSQDGLEFISPPPANNDPNGNEVRIQVSSHTPTIETVNTKYGVPYVRHRDFNRDIAIEIDKFGIHQRFTDTIQLNLTSGIDIEHDLVVGMTKYVITLATNWVFATHHNINVTLRREITTPIQLMSAYCYIDNYLGPVAGNVKSHVFIRRHSAIREHSGLVKQLFQLERHAENNETQFPAGTKIILQVDNRMLIH